MKSYSCVSSERRSCLCNLLVTISLIMGTYFIGSAWLEKDFLQLAPGTGPVSTEESVKCEVSTVLDIEVNDTREHTHMKKCNDKCRPVGTEALPKGIVSATSNLELIPFTGPISNNNLQKTMSLLAIPVGIKQKPLVNKVVKKFLQNGFAVMLFHYDGIVDEWHDMEWSGRVIHVSATNQTKWWFAKRFLHPDIVADYEYVFLWDEDLGVENFHPGETSVNRVFIRRGLLHIIQQSRFQTNPSLEDSLRCLVSGADESETRALDAIQLQLRKKIGEYPERAYRNVHRVRVRVPVSVAWVLKHEPCLITLAVEGFYDRDIDSMKYAVKMEKFLPKGKAEEMVEVVVRMSRAMYAQLVQQKFQAPGCFPMPERSNVAKYLVAELGMKITCGFEMMYQLRKKHGDEGKGSTWEAFRESLEKFGYFEGLLQGSKEYKRLMEKAEGYYRNSSLHVRASEVLSTPVKRIDEILALPHSADDFMNQELPPSDDDSWLYGGEDELNAALLERQKEMEVHSLKHNKKNKSKEQQDGSASSKYPGKYDLEGVAKSMKTFVEKMSSYEGAEVPQDRNLKDVDFDVDQFMKDIETVMGHPGSREDGSDIDPEDGLSTDLDFDDYEEDSEHSEDMEEERDDEFMNTYSDALSKELKDTTLSKTFVRAHEESSKKDDEGTSGSGNNEMDDFSPVDVDFNLVKNFLESYSSQEGLSGPASNLLGLMGLSLPDDAGKGK